ncbi:CcdC protein domain-containing protein [Paenibacillus guangzhouensis]|uniref:CcdC protein domain-containing protein n=1 Tax=Paenibacillus guangzhouensis TaxID=1473112 RepID=UPI00187B5839|nr:CcdC protein domain-containing protein [Paenibacillus guangzhouensis]
MNTLSIYLIVVVVILLSIGKEKAIQPSRMWITPALFAWLVYSSLSQTTNLTPLSFVLYIICLAVGLGIGVWRGSLDKVRYNPSTGKITSQSSIGGVIVFLAVMLLRLAVGYWGKEHALVSLSNALLFIPLGSVCARRYVIYMKYQRLQGQRR